MKSPFAYLIVFLLLCSCAFWKAPTASAETSCADCGPKLPQRALPVSPLPPKQIDWRKEIIYFLLIDRFADGDTSNNSVGDLNSHKKFIEGSKNYEDLKTYQGGDILGVISKLDYIKSTGATAIWLSPVYENSDSAFMGWWPYHGYHPTDHFAVENHFGDMKTLKRLVNEAHARGLKVILDTVYNQVGPNHSWVKDSINWKEKGFSKWFNPHSGKDESTSIKDWENQTELETKELFGLPDLRQENEHVYQYLLDMSKYWIDSTGADGFRLDAVKHINQKFWRRINADLHDRYGKDFLMLGEVLHGDPKYMAKYQGDGFNALFDIPLYFDMRRVFAEGNSMEVLSGRILEDARVYKSDGAIWSTLLDNHDLVRFAYAAKDSVREKIKNAITFLAAFNGIPVIYYGTEVALQGGPITNDKGEGTDYLNRRFMPWEKVAAETKRGGIAEHMAAVFEFRKRTPSLYSGKFLELYKDACVYVFAKVGELETSVAAFNNCVEKQTVSVPLRYAMAVKGDAFADFRNERVLKVEKSAFSIELDGYSSNVFKGTNRQKNVLPSDYELGVALSQVSKVGFVTVNFVFTPLEKYVGASSVAIAGDFNGWNPSSNQMQKSADGKNWQISTQMRQGRHPYKFVINGKDWVEDHNAKIFEGDGVGGRNSVVVVP